MNEELGAVRASRNCLRFAECVLSLLLVLSLAGITCAGKINYSDSAHELYNQLASEELDNLADVIAEYEYQQESELAILPPDPEFILWQEIGIRVFDAGGFPDEFVKGLVPESSDGIPTYRIWIRENPETRNREVWNAEGAIIASIPPPDGYDPDWFLKSTYPEVYSPTFPGSQVEYLAASCDPSRIGTGITLVEKKDLAKYVAKQIAALKAADDAAAKLSSDGGIGIMMAYEGPPVEDLQFTAVQPTNTGFLVTLAYPAGYTNGIEFFSCPDLISFWWDSAGTTNINASTNWIEWVYTQTNNTPRFIAAGNSQLDSDSDGLKDAREKYMYHTSATNTDSDYDGLTDYNEVINLHTDPNNNDTNKPAISIMFPTNNFAWVWLP